MESSSSSRSQDRLQEPPLGKSRGRCRGVPAQACRPPVPGTLPSTCLTLQVPPAAPQLGSTTSSPLPPSEKSATGCAWSPWQESSDAHDRSHLSTPTSVCSITVKRDTKDTVRGGIAHPGTSDGGERSRRTTYSMCPNEGYTRAFQHRQSCFRAKPAYRQRPAPSRSADTLCSEIAENPRLNSTPCDSHPADHEAALLLEIDALSNRIKDLQRKSSQR